MTLVSAAEYVGAARCAECHESEAKAWRGSHHDLAMAEATEETVLGDFDDAQFTAHGVTSRFYRKDGVFYIRTDGPDGALQNYSIRLADLLERDPVQPDAAFSLVDIYRDRGDIAAARRKLEAIKQYRPRDPRIEALEKELADE